MSKKRKRRVKLVYENWHEMLKNPKNDRKQIMWYFMGAWTAFTDSQIVEFLGMTTKKDRKVLMTYPLWQ